MSSRCKNKGGASELFTLSALTNILNKFSDEEYKKYYKSGPEFYRTILNPHYTKLGIYTLCHHIDLTDDSLGGYDVTYLTDLCRLKYNKRINKHIMRTEISKLIVLYYTGGLDEIRKGFQKTFSNGKIFDVIDDIKNYLKSHYPKNITSLNTLFERELDPYSLLVVLMLYSFNDIGKLPGKSSKKGSTLNEVYPNIVTILKIAPMHVRYLIEDILPNAMDYYNNNITLHIEDIPAEFFDSPSNLLQSLINTYINNGCSCPNKEELTDVAADATNTLVYMGNSSGLAIGEECFKDLCNIVCNVRGLDYIIKLSQKYYNTNKEFYNLFGEFIKTKRNSLERER